MTEVANADATPVIRATYEEYDLDGTRVAMIADPTNAHAWIQSNVTATNDP
jgi:hypothetical protein